jgi:glycosyltransferase involved in cell wall biosynthesis
LILAKWITRVCGTLCDRVVAVSRTVKAALLLAGVARRKVRVIHNGVELRCDGEWRASRLGQDRLAEGGSKPIFANVGQFVPWKKQSAFLLAARHVASRFPEGRFWLVGADLFGRRPGYETELRKMAKTLGIHDQVRFLGWQDDMDAIWRQVTCLVHTADKEPFGRVIIEAMAHGVPVIAVGASGPAEVVENSRTGLLVPPDDVEALAGAMLAVAGDSRLADRLARAAYDRVKTDFTAERTAASVERLYEDLMGKAGRGGGERCESA